MAAASSSAALLPLRPSRTAIAAAAADHHPFCSSTMRGADAPPPITGSPGPHSNTNSKKPFVIYIERAGRCMRPRRRSLGIQQQRRKNRESIWLLVGAMSAF